MKYSEDWFSHNVTNITNSLKRVDGSIQRILEVGSFEGRSACWFMTNVLPEDGTLYCLDIWPNPEIHQTFLKNTAETKKPAQTLNIIKAPSYNGLASLIVDTVEPFDVAYIDGSHTAYDTITDMAMAWGMLRSGGVMLIDDYRWNHANEECEKPKVAVDSFVSCFANKLEIIHTDWQMHILKK